MKLPTINYQNKWALITGASSGLGYEFAVQLAEKGVNLFINARSLETLRELKVILEGKYGIRTEVIPVDLSKPEAPHQIVEYIKQFNVNVDILINNAGFGLSNTFYNQDTDDIHRMNMVNMVSLADLCNIFIKGMIKRSGIGIINVGSIAAFQPLPYSANYAATKAYVFSLTAALHQEVLKKGVRVSCLCPGPIKTNFFNAAGITNPVGKFASAESVVQQAIKAFEKNQLIVIPKEHKLGLFRLGPLVPTKTKLKIAEKMFNQK